MKKSNTKRQQKVEDEKKPDSPLGWRVIVSGLLITVIGGFILNAVWKRVEPSLFPSSMPTLSAVVTQQAVVTTSMPKEMITVVETIKSSSTLVQPTPTQVLPTVTMQPVDTPQPQPTNTPLPTAVAVTEGNPCLGHIRSPSGRSVQTKETVGTGSTYKTLENGTAVIVAGKADTGIGKWYGITDENGFDLGYIESEKVDVSLNCSNY